MNAISVVNFDTYLVNFNMRMNIICAFILSMYRDISQCGEFFSLCSKITSS